MRLFPVPLAVVLFLAACGAGPTLVAVPVAPVGDRVGVGFGRVELLDVSLPTYAQNPEIYVEGAGGALTAVEDRIWADDPQRGVTLDLARALGAVTTAQVAAAPWPFDSFPDARVDVRVSEMVAGVDGVYRLSGQYYVAARDGSGRERVRDFRLTTPFAPDAGPAAIAAARATVTASLARDIAEQGLR